LPSASGSCRRHVVRNERSAWMCEAISNRTEKIPWTVFS